MYETYLLTLLTLLILFLYWLHHQTEPYHSNVS